MSSNPTRESSQQGDDMFGLISRYSSYVSKPEITDLLPNFLVKGSQNVLIDYAQRVISRNGFTLYNQANTGKGPIKGSYDWQTSTNKFFNLRSYDQNLEFDWNGTYNVLLSNLLSPKLQFTKVLDFNEQTDVLLFVQGGQYMQRWSGGVSKIRKSTATTLTKQGVITDTTIVFTAGTTGTVAPTITDTAANFLNAGFATGDTLTVVGSTNNSRNFTIGTVTADTITLIMSNILVSEAAGPSITLHNGEPTWKSSRFFSTINGRKFTYKGVDYFYSGGETTDTLTAIGLANGTSLGSPSISNATPAVVTLVAHGLVAGDVVTFKTAGTLPSPLAINTPYYVIAAGLDPNDFEISTTLGGTAINTTTVGSGIHTLYKATPSLSSSVGDSVWQTADSISLPTDIITPFPYFYPNKIQSQLNSVILGSDTHLMTFGSSISDYTNFALTSPRAPGDPWQKPLTGGPCQAIIPVDTDSDILNIQSNLVFQSGFDVFDKVDFHMSQDNTQELLRIFQYKNARGSGIASANAFCTIKNATPYISNEPSLDFLGKLESIDGKNNTPLSDPIKDDFDSYDFTDCNIIYWKRALFISLPVEGLVLIYDLMRNLWQPPQTIPVGCFSIIAGQLYGHSSVTNETYKLFTGTNDNSIPIPQIARFAYNNGGNRSSIKNMSQYWSDGYITPNGQLGYTINYGFAGSDHVSPFTILGSDNSIASSSTANPLGELDLGNTIIGGYSPFPLAGIIGTNSPMLRFYQIDSIPPRDYIENYVEYTMNTLDGQFALVAHGSNQFYAGTVSVTHTK